MRSFLALLVRLFPAEFRSQFVAIGVAVAVGTTRVLGNLLFGVEAADVGTFLGMSLAMMLVGLLASYMPARRASSVDPIQALRGE